MNVVKGRKIVFEGGFILVPICVCVGILLFVVAKRAGYMKALKEMRGQYSDGQSHDPLTGLLNRQTFLHHLDERIEKNELNATPFTVALLNVHRFRWINDALGNELGDTIIKNIAQQIRSSVGDRTVIARLNGDEFAILLDDDIERSTQIMAEIVKFFESTPIAARGNHIHILISVGIAGYPQHGTTGNKIITYADTALSIARQTYSEVVVFEPEMNRDFFDYYQIANDLRFAIQNQELSLVFQPRIDLITGRVSTVEALLRWQHPKLGTVSPARFIPIAEETGSIMLIGLWVLRTACEAAASWSWNGSDTCRISVNLSVQQLLYPGFLASLDDILRRTGLMPNRLELELTESIFIEEPQEIAGLLEQVKQRGIRIAIDDFGKGYSSLNYLKSYPADTLKIDKQFISDIQSATGRIIVAFIIQLARRLGLTVVAEGVELPKQVAFLLEEGCDEVQGYLLCKPVSLEQMESFAQQFNIETMMEAHGISRIS